MAKITANYETMYIIDPTLDTDATEALMNKFKSLVETKGTITEVNPWGKRRLAYPINDMMDGYYVLMTYQSSADLPAELDRVFRITEGVMRSMTICND
ncbi:MAG: 30S ribosomal protein S6 [Eubacteriales bacterium]